MDPRRLLILAATSLVLSGCALLRGPASPTASLAVETIVPPGSEAEPASPRVADIAAPVPDELPGPDETPQPITAADPEGAQPYEPAVGAPAASSRTADVENGRAAIAAANVAARAASNADDFVGGTQVFAWTPGRVFEIWTAPLRVTTLTLSPGEALLAKAAGDTVRWQIGEASSGSGAEARTHVMLKPLQRGLETNLILTTSRRVYLIELKSGGPDAFNAAVAWDTGATSAETPVAIASGPEAARRVPNPVVTPEGSLDGRYRIEPQGRRARWTPTAVFNDGVRTFITLDPDVEVDEAPVLFVLAADGEAQMVNYRQVGGLFVVDRVFDRAELRLGDRRPQVVRIRRMSGDRS